MVRRLTPEEREEQRKRAFPRLVALENSFVGRVASNRPRDPEKERILARMDLARKENYVSSGRIVIRRPGAMKPKTDSL